ATISSSSFTTASSFALHQLVAVARRQVKTIETLELLDALERRRAERRLAFEGMQHDAFDEIAETDLVILRDRLQHLQDALFDAHAGLRALDGAMPADGHGGSAWHCGSGSLRAADLATRLLSTLISWYQDTMAAPLAPALCRHVE